MTDDYLTRSVKKSIKNLPHKKDNHYTQKELEIKEKIYNIIAKNGNTKLSAEIVYDVIIDNIYILMDINNNKIKHE